MKKSILLGIVCLAICGNMHGQGFLKKLSNAVDKVGQKVEKVTNDVKQVGKNIEQVTNPRDTQGAQENSGRIPSSSGNIDDSDEYPNIKKSYLFYATESFDDAKDRIAKYATFKKTGTTKVIKVDDILSMVQLGNFQDGRIFARFNNRLLCLDERGNIIKEWSGRIEDYFEYNYASSDVVSELDSRTQFIPIFDSGYTILYEKDESSLYHTALICDKNFNVVKKIPRTANYTYFSNGIAFFETSEPKKDKMGRILNDGMRLDYYDTKGNRVFNTLSANITQSFKFGASILSAADFRRPLCDGRAAFYMSGESSPIVWGFRDASGNAVIPAKYLQVQDFSNGLAAVSTDVSGTVKWGFIDTTGRMVIDPMFTKMPSKFDKCGLAMVEDLSGKVMYINKKGEIVSDKYDWATPFCNGKALCQIDTPQNRYIAMIDMNFNQVSLISPSYVESYFLDDNHIYARFHDTELCMLSDTGELIMAGLEGPFVNGLAPVYSGINNSQTASIGYVNMQGEWVIKFEKNEF